MIRFEDLAPYMLEMPDGSMVVGTAEMIEELEALPPDEREKRLSQMISERE